MTIVLWLIFACLLTTCHFSEGGSLGIFNSGPEFGNGPSSSSILDSPIQVFGQSAEALVVRFHMALDVSQIYAYLHE